MRAATFTEKKHAYKASPKDVDEALKAVEHRLSYARVKHPEGSSILDVAFEFGEVMRAHQRESEERFQDELLDLIVVCLRLKLGETQRS